MEVVVGKYKFQLFVTGNTSRSELAITNLYRMCEKYLSEQWEVVIIDVLEQPFLAEEAKILATPTLLKVSPPPVRKVIGDLSDLEKVMAGLGLYKEQIRPQGG
jgi:circadian clock protein KaiB